MDYKQLISTGELFNSLDQKDLIIFDCRFKLSEPDKGSEWYREGHIPGAIYAHLDNDLSGEIIPGETGRHPLPDPYFFASKLREWGVNNSSQVICYDQGVGAYAARLWWMMKWVGHPKVAILDGGFSAWMDEDRPASKDRPPQKPGNFIPDVQQQLLVHLDQEELHKRKNSIIVDARDRIRYLGIEEPIDSIAGHIPGAKNSPWKENMNEGHWKSGSDLKEKFGNLIQPGVEIISYCGSGVTGCHNIFAMHLAGRKDILLYPGSWSDWITKEENQIATGEEE